MQAFVLHARSGEHDTRDWRLISVTTTLDEAIEFAYEDMQADLESTDREKWPMFTDVSDYTVHLVRADEFLAKYWYHPNEHYELAWDGDARLGLRDRDLAWFRAQWTGA